LKLIAGICLIAFSFACSSLIAFASDCREGKLLLIAIDRVGWQDIEKADMPNLDSLVKSGSIGLMTTNTAGRLTQRNAYITIGSGARLEGTQKSALGLSVNEKYMGERAGDVFYQITGRVGYEDSLVNLSIAQVKRYNERRPYTVNVGALGEVLRDEGYSIALVGNSDIPQHPRRFLTDMLMDDLGIIPMGIVGEQVLKTDDKRPFGIATDYEEMYEAITRFWDAADLLAVELGDTSRAEEFGVNVSAERLAEHRQTALEESDAFIGRLLKRIDMQNDLVMVIVPVGPTHELRANNRLTPIILNGKGIGRGWATSASTRRDGIVTNLDISATILNFFDVVPLHGQGGEAIRTGSAGLGLNELKDLNRRLLNLFNQRRSLIRGHVFLQILALFAATYMILFNKKHLNKIKNLLVFIMIIPLSYMLVTPFFQNNIWINAPLIIAINMLITLIVLFSFKSVLSGIAAVCIAVTVVILIDQWLGGNLIKWSPMGYDVISGARFYGIGNEYMGVLIGASSTGVGSLVQISDKNKCNTKRIASLIHLSVFATLALPWLGVNLGGAVSSFSALGAWLVMSNKWGINAKTVTAMLAVIILLVTGIFVLDSLRDPGVQSHIGQTARLVSRGGIVELIDIAYRKVSMNIRLLGYTVWTNLVIVSLISVGLLIYRPIGILKKVMHELPFASYGIAAGTVGSVAALLLNDSGIVAAATAIAYIVFPLKCLVIERFIEA